ERHTEIGGGGVFNGCGGAGAAGPRHADIDFHGRSRRGGEVDDHAAGAASGWRSSSVRSQPSMRTILRSLTAAKTAAGQSATRAAAVSHRSTVRRSIACAEGAASRIERLRLKPDIGEAREG